MDKVLDLDLEDLGLGTFAMYLAQENFSLSNSFIMKKHVHILTFS